KLGNRRPAYLERRQHGVAPDGQHREVAPDRTLVRRAPRGAHALLGVLHVEDAVDAARWARILDCALVVVRAAAHATQTGDVHDPFRGLIFPTLSARAAGASFIGSVIRRMPS